MTRAVPAALLLALALPPAAEAKVYDVPAELGSSLSRVAKRTSVPVRVPRSIDLDFDGATFASGSGGRRRWSLSLAGAPDCGGATACFLATFSGERGGTPAFKRTVRLARGITGYYKPLSCGGSCSPPMLEWRQDGVLYGIQAKIGAAGAAAQRDAIVAAANSAIRSKPR